MSSPLEKLFESTYSKKRSTAFVVKLKKNVNGELDELIKLTKILDENYTSPAITQRIKHYVNQDFSIYKCNICNDPLFYREKPNPSYLNTCGRSECKKKQNWISTASSIKKTYGVDNISQSQTWREKVIATNLERRGVKWNTQSTSFIKARKKSWVENGAAQFDTIWKRKEYIFPSGKIVKVQGYEPKCLDELLASGYLEEDIVTGNAEIEKYIGKITYNDEEGKKHRYYPDIFIISENRVIEVKSNYTLSQDRLINRKREAALSQNLMYSLKIY